MNKMEEKPIAVSSQVLDYWSDDETKKHYCLVNLIYMYHYHQKQELLLQESPYDTNKKV